VRRSGHRVVPTGIELWSLQMIPFATGQLGKFSLQRDSSNQACRGIGIDNPRDARPIVRQRNRSRRSRSAGKLAHGRYAVKHFDLSSLTVLRQSTDALDF
jgi:hypothetical protein